MNWTKFYQFQLISISSQKRRQYAVENTQWMMIYTFKINSNQWITFGTTERTSFRWGEILLFKRSVTIIRTIDKIKFSEPKKKYPNEFNEKYSNTFYITKLIPTTAEKLNFHWSMTTTTIKKIDHEMDKKRNLN